MTKNPTRRDVLLSLGGSAAFAACTGRPTRHGADTATTTVPISEEPRVCAPSAENIEGPFFKPSSPQRADLTDGDARGEALVVEGSVLDVGCVPVPGAWLEVWQADHAGAYDNEGDRFRATLALAESGRYRFKTIVPGRYLNGRQYRPAHIHVKAHAPGYRSLTTQLYFEGDPFNAVDPFIDASLIMSMDYQSVGNKRTATCSFDFVLERGR